MEEMSYGTITLLTNSKGNKLISFLLLLLLNDMACFHGFSQCFFLNRKII